MYKLILTDTTTAIKENEKVTYVALKFDPTKQLLTLGSTPTAFIHVHNLTALFYPDIDDLIKGLDVINYQKSRVRYKIKNMSSPKFFTILKEIENCGLYKVEHVKTLGRLI